MSRACLNCGFVPQLPPAGGVCPYCGMQGAFTPGCFQLVVWIIGIVALLVALGA